MNLLNKFLAKTEFKDYEDFSKNYRVIIPDNFNFSYDVVDFFAENQPEKLALIYCNDDGEEQYFTFKQVSELSKKIASYFISLGIGKGDKVITLLRRRYEYWLTAVACHRIGAVLVPVSVQMEKNDLIYRINSCSAKIIVAITDEFVMRQLDGIKNDCSCLQNICFLGHVDGFLDFNDYKKAYLYEEERNTINTDDMLIYYTSGTSAYPKQTVHNSLYPLGHIITGAYLHQVVDDGLHITFADSGWAKFGWGNIYGQWISGTAILGYDPKRFNSQKFIDVIKKYRPTTVCLPPTIYRMLIRDGLKKGDFDGVINFTSAGEPLQIEINEIFKGITGKYIREGFGQSEGTPIFANWKYVDVRPGSAGKRSPQNIIEVIDANGNVCKENEEGEIIIRENNGGFGLFKGYIYEDKFISPYKDGIYYTSDTAIVDEDGYVHIMGRTDDVIKSSGYRISPYEVENTLIKHPAIKECAITGVKDDLRGQIVCAVVTLKEGYTADEDMTKSIKEFVKTNTAPYKYPRKVFYVDEIKKTTSGKIARKWLKDYANGIKD